MNIPPQFLFISCQIGAEPAVKAELARRWPGFRFAYSRPGFLTFKLPGGLTLTEDFDLHSVFARAYGFSLGKAAGDDVAARAQAALQLFGQRAIQRLHVWQRDAALPGHHGYEPGDTPAAAEARAAIVAAWPDRDAAAKLLEPTEPGQLVLDCVLVEPAEWWIGVHRASATPSRWPGGVPAIAANENRVSRAYLKMAEALEWSRLPVSPGDQVAEIGSAPGGSSQALLEQGLQVLGIDPAEMDPLVAANRNFQHLKMRGADVRRREFAEVRWLTADINIAPNYTLDTVEAIVTHPEVKPLGLLLTLKLLDWSLAEHVHQWVERVKSWGFAEVRARQLAHNRQEICIFALRQRDLRKRLRKPGKPHASEES